MSKTDWTSPGVGAARKLYEALVAADTEGEVVKILQTSGLWDDDRVWRLYGDQEDNFSAAGAQQNNPEAALVEKAINSVDASLMGRALAAGIDPRSAGAPQTPREAVAILYEGVAAAHIPDSAGYMANWTPSKRTDVARGITIALTGPRTHKPSVSIADAGEGQAPEGMPNTILSLMRGNKKSIPFVQGKFNMGGTGALRFCGYHNLQLVISKRHPAVAKKEGSSSAWGFTLVRRENPGATRISTYKYLAPIAADSRPRRGNILGFEAATMPIFPVAQKPYERQAEWGTLIKLYEYDTRYDGHFFMKGGLLHRLDIMMPGLILPMRLHECRAFRGEERSFETTLTGLEVRLRAQETTGTDEGNLEEGFPDSGPIGVDSETIKYTVYAFKRQRHESYKTNQGLVFVVNGQTHGTISDSFFSRANVGLGYLAKSLLVVLDCSEMQDRTKEDLFMNSRDRLADARLAQRIEAELAEALRRHPGLEALKNKRRQEDIASRIGDSKPVEEMLRNMIKRSPALARLFFPGAKLSNPFATTDAPVAPKYVGKLHPTYFRFRDREYGEIVKREAHLDQRLRLTLETDVVNDYFRRAAKPGKVTVEATLAGVPVGLTYSGNLYDGLFNVNMQLPIGAVPGDELDIKLSIEDETLVEPFVNSALLAIAPPVTKNPKPGGARPPHPNKDKDGPTEKRPAGIDIPEPTPVYREGWDKHSAFTMDRFSAMRAVQADASADDNHIQLGSYDFFVNMDNDYVLAEQKAHSKNAEMIKHKYKFGMTLISIAALRYVASRPQLEDGTEPDDDDSKPWSVEEIVAATTDVLAPALLPMIDVLSELDESDLAVEPADLEAVEIDD